MKKPPMQIKNGEYDQASNDEVCSDNNNKADPRQYIYEQKTKQGLISERNLSLQLGRSVYPYNRPTSLFSGLCVDEKDHPHCRPNHTKKEKKYINGTNNTKNSNNIRHEHEHGHGHGHGQGKEKEKEKENEKENDNGNKSSNSNNDRNNSGNSNNNNNRNNSKTKDNTIILPTTVPIVSSNPNPNRGISVEEEIEEETTLDINRHHYPPTTTKNNMRDNNISKMTDTLQVNKNSATQNLVHTRTRKSILPVHSPSQNSIPTQSHTSQQVCTIPSSLSINYSIDSAKIPRSTNVSKTLSGFYSRNPRPPA